MYISTNPQTREFCTSLASLSCFHEKATIGNTSPPKLSYINKSCVGFMSTKYSGLSSHGLSVSSNLSSISHPTHNMFTIRSLFTPTQDSHPTQAKLGPLRATLLACPPILMAWISIACATSLPFIYVSRFLVGIGNGILLSSVYSVEIATPEKRGSVVMVSTKEVNFRNPLRALKKYTSLVQ